MIELFKKQLDKNGPLTKKDIVELSYKTYFNGEEIKPGEQVLCALIKEGDWCEDKGRYLLTAIALNERHLNLFTPDIDFKINVDEFVPIIEYAHGKQ